MARLKRAIFNYDAADGPVSVTFEDGAVYVEFEEDWEKTLCLENPGKKWKPCDTHCKKLIARALRQKPQGKHARRRAGESK